MPTARPSRPGSNRARGRGPAWGLALILAATRSSALELGCGELALRLEEGASAATTWLGAEPLPFALETGSPGLASPTSNFAIAADWSTGEHGEDRIRLEGTLAASWPGLPAEGTFARTLRPLGGSTGAGSAAASVAQDIELVFGAPVRDSVATLIPLLSVSESDLAQVFYPRRDGRGLVLEASALRCATFDLASDPIAEDCVPLALPLIDLLLNDGRRIAVHADPLWGLTFSFSRAAGRIVLAAGARLPGDRVSFTRHLRSFDIELHAGGPEVALDAFFSRHAPHRGPIWTRGIALVYFDYLAEGGRAWRQDLDALASRVKQGERGRVAVALHGWYDRIGSYSFDPGRLAFLPSWQAQPGRTGGVKMTVAEIRARLEQARALGFRTLLYYADGMVADASTAMGARATKELGLSSWNGPEVAGELRVQNPADPAVRRWFLDYTDALLAAFGDLLDGLVWDETFWVRTRAVATRPVPAHADVAMMSLTRLIADRVHAYRPDLAFLASDAIGHEGISPPPYALMSHGTFQDSECNPWAWSFGLFPNWRAPLWSVNWGARVRFEDTRLGVLRFGAPVSLANGWADDLGPGEMPAALLERALALFSWLTRNAARPPWLEEDPDRYLARALPGELPTGPWRIAAALSDTPPREDDPGWITRVANPLRYLDLASALPAGVRAAWAEAIVATPTNAEVDLIAGSHGPVRIWLDGRELLRVRDPRRHQAGSDFVPGLELAAGEHRLRVRVERTASGFGFSLRLQGALE